MTTPNATMDGRPFYSSAVERERERERARLAYIFHGDLAERIDPSAEDYRHDEDPPEEEER